MASPAPLTVPEHIATLRGNVSDIRRLLAIHQQVAGSGPGYKHNVEVLNKSAIVLLVACWEAFVEDLARDAFSYLLDHSPKCTTFPPKVLALAGKDLKADLNETRIWDLAGDGWKTVLRNHEVQIFKRFLGNFNTPRSTHVEQMFLNLIGLPDLSKAWHWKKMATAGAVAKLDALVELRGEIAHRVGASKTVFKADVRRNLTLIVRLAVASSNRVNLFIKERTTELPWRMFFVAPGT